MASKAKTKTSRYLGIVTDEIMDSPVLVGEWGVLRGASEETRAEFRARARLYATSKGFEFYREGDPAQTNSLWIPLHGRYRIEHPSPENEYKRVFHAYYGPGMPFGELEVICKDDVMRERVNVTRVYVECYDDDSQVIVVDNAEFLLNDIVVLRNFARLLCRKLLDTGASHDTNRISPRLKAALRLRNIYEEERRQGRVQTLADGRVMFSAGTKTDIANEENINRQPVSRLFTDLLEAGMKEKDGQLILPSCSFLEEAVANVKRGRRQADLDD